MQEKNVLIISPNGFSSVGCNKTYETIFSSFKKENLKSFFTRPQDPNIDYNYCSNYYSVSESDIISRLLLRTQQCGHEVLCNSNIDYNSKVYNSFKNKRIKKIGILRDILWKSKLWNTPQFRQWCEKIHADLIFFHAPGSSGLHEIAWFIAKYLNIPLATYFTDDYIISPKYDTIWDRFQQIRRKKFYKRTIDKSFIQFCIGELMAAEYEKYFNKHFEYIMNSVDIIPYTEKYSYSTPFVISHFGTLHGERWRLIVRFSEIFNDAAKVNVYTPTPINAEIKEAFDKSGVIFHGCIPNEKLKETMLNSDFLLHAETDHPYYRTLFKLSVSTKIPEYLIAGRVVIGFGSIENASMRLLSDNRIGIVISSDMSDDEIRKSFFQICYNKKECESFRLRAYEYAKNHFDKKIIATSFKEKLLSCFKQ